MPKPRSGRRSKRFNLPRVRAKMILDLRFEAKKMERVFSAAERRSLVRMGGYARTAMRALLNRQRQTVSPPGTPPRRLTGILRHFVFWRYDHHRRDIVIGPEFIAKLHRGSQVVPGLLDQGGSTVVRRKANLPWMRGRRISYTAMYQPRPYVERARLSAEKDLDKAWKDSVRET